MVYARMRGAAASYEATHWLDIRFNKENNHQQILKNKTLRKIEDSGFPVGVFFEENYE